MGNGQGGGLSEIDDAKAAAFVKAGGELVSKLGPIFNSQQPSLNIPQELIDADNLVYVDLQGIEMEKQQLITEKEQIKDRLIELSPLLPQGNRDVLMEAIELISNYKRVDDRIDNLGMKTASLEVRIREGMRLQRLLKLITVNKQNHDELTEVLTETMQTTLPVVVPLMSGPPEYKDAEEVPPPVIQNSDNEDKDKTDS